MECPKCGSTNVMPTYIKGKYKCMECGALFSAPASKQQGASNAFNLKKKEG